MLETASIKLKQDIGVLTGALDSFSALTGFSAYAVDTEGKIIAGKDSFSDFCKSCAKNGSCGKCSDTYKSLFSERRSIFNCGAGLTCFASPIMYGKSCVAYLVGGQVLTAAPDDNFASRASSALGAEAEKCSEKADSIPVVPIEKINAAAGMLASVAALASKPEADGNSDNRLDNAAEIIRTAGAKLRDVSESVIDIDGVFSSICTTVEGMDETIKEIENVAMNTKILGFNASIEASRAKEAGKGFGVIAQEIRSLAETSKIAADGIFAAMKQINEQTREIRTEVKKSRAVIDECVADYNSFTAHK